MFQKNNLEKSFELNSTSREAVIAMESRDHLSNGVSPKDQMSRGNIIRAFLILVSVIGFGISVTAQDVITLKNGTDINALVQKVGEVEIEYKKFDNPKGPNYTLKKSEILIIRYENGTKDIFSEEARPVEKKDVSMSEPTSVRKDENIKTVYLQENAQSRKDVIVKTGGIYAGFQTKITHTSDKHIFYSNDNGKEKKIKQKKVAFTLTFDEKAKQEKYPVEMSVEDFLSLPVYWIYENGDNWIVFGTHSISNLSQLKEYHQNIYDNYVKGTKLKNTGAVLTGLGVFFFPLIIPGIIIFPSGYEKINNALSTYYNNCVDLEVCAKYGIIITPYNVPHIFKNIRK